MDKIEQQNIDIKNLRFYAELFSKNGWETDVLHNSVFTTTLTEIASRIAESQMEAMDLRITLTTIEQKLQHEWDSNNLPNGWRRWRLTAWENRAMKAEDKLAVAEKRADLLKANAEDAAWECWNCIQENNELRAKLSSAAVAERDAEAQP